MTAGYFIRIDNGKAISVRDHEIDIRDKAFAKKLGVPDHVFAKFNKFEPVKDRIEFLQWLLIQVPIIKVQGYGVWTGIQWGNGRDTDALKTVHKWGQKVFGPCMMLIMSNIATRNQYDMFWMLFDAAMQEGKRIKPVCIEVSRA